MQGSDCDASGCSRCYLGGDCSSLGPFAGAMWPLLVLLLGLASCGSAQLLFLQIKYVEYTYENKTILIPCLVTNAEPRSLREMFVKWRFNEKFFFYYDGDKNFSFSKPIFSTAYIVPEELLKGNASLIMDKREAVPGNYSCEVTELTREGEIFIELKFVKVQLLFTTIKSAEYTNLDKIVVIPCLFTNSMAKDLIEMFVKWKFRDQYIFNYNGTKNESKPTSKFLSAYIIPAALLTGNASLLMNKSQAVPGQYTCEVSELNKEGNTTIELKYRFVKPPLIFTTIKSVEYTDDNKIVLIPCLVTNSRAKSLKEMFVKWKFRGSYIFNYDGARNKSKPTSEFSSAYIIPNALLRGNASLMMNRSQAVPGNYTCEISELTKEGKTTIELKYIPVKPPLIFTTIKSVEYTDDNKIVLIPCLVTNSRAKSLKEMFVKWKFRGSYIFNYDGARNKSKPTSEFSSAYIIPNALLRGNASLMMNRSQAVPGNYTCEISELTKEGKTTIELKYIPVKPPLIFTTIKSVEYTDDNKIVLIPCLVTNSRAKSLKEMFVKWKFRGSYIFNYDGARNKSKPTSEFSSAYIIPNALLRGNASLMMNRSQAVPGNYTCEISELTKEGKTTIELKYIPVKPPLIFTTIKSVEYTEDNATVLIPCLVTNSRAKSLKEMFVKWKFGDSYIFNYDGDKNKSRPTNEFSSAYIIPNALLRGNASLMMNRSQAVPGRYTCEILELTKEGKTTIELKYIPGSRMQCYSCVNPVGLCTITRKCAAKFDACLYVKTKKQTLYQCWKFESCNFKHISKVMKAEHLQFKCCRKELCNKSIRSSSGKSITGTITLLVTLLLTALWKLLI